jgi:hypothetical protein
VKPVESKVHRKSSAAAPPAPGRGPTTGWPESVHGPVGVGAVATPIALSFLPSNSVVSVTPKYMT